MRLCPWKDGIPQGAKEGDAVMSIEGRYSTKNQKDGVLIDSKYRRLIHSVGVDMFASEVFRDARTF